MREEFRAIGCKPWGVTDDALIYGGQTIPYKELTSFNLATTPSTSLMNGVIQTKHKGRILVLGFKFSDKDRAQKAYEYARQQVIAANGQVTQTPAPESASAQPGKPIQEPLPDGAVYSIEGVRGRHIVVYEDKCVLSTKATFGSFVTGNISDGEKTIYYVDCIGVQFKKSGLQIGYLQLETASAIMNNRNNNFFNENSFTFDTTKISNEEMEEVANYVKQRVEEAKTRKNAPVVTAAAPSAADEIKKFKELLDLGIITQEEFDAKKKQLLGL